MPGEDYQSWSVTAVNNGNSDTSIEYREGQARRTVNDSARSEMAAHAKNRNLLNGSITTGGSANAQTFTSGVGYIAPIPTGLIVKLKIGAGLTNTASTTLNMDGIGDTVIKTDIGDNLRGGELVGGCYTDFIFNGTNWIFLYSREFWQEQINGGGGVIIGKQIFSTPGMFSYTPTSGMEACIIECVGGGGGGGCASSNSILIVGGGGGGSGGYSRTYSDATGIGASQAVVVGAGGTAATSPSAGGAGGDTSLGSLCIAKGGSGGGGSLTGGSTGIGGAGGVTGTGDIIAAGSPGQTGAYNATTTTYAPGGGSGGSSCFGGGAVGNVADYGGTAVGAAARNYGSGGAGSLSHGGSAFSASGAGSGGIIIITEFAGRGTPGRDGTDGVIGPIGPAGPSGAGTGDVLRSGTPTNGQVAVWTDASHIQGVASSTLITALNVVMQKFTASGTYTPTAGMRYCIIETIGGGGAGGGVVSNATYVLGGGGGGAGGYSRKRATAAEIGVSIGVVVGAGGTGSTGNGTSGVATTVGAICGAWGGTGGLGGTTGNVGVGGAGAVVGTGDVAATGASGGTATFWSGATAGFVAPAGAGGNSYYGGGGVGGVGVSTASAVNGGTAAGYGAGGGGASANNGTGNAIGGSGSPGLVIITEFLGP